MGVVMEIQETLTQFIQSGPVGIVAAAIVYLIVYFQRNNTKKSRDGENENIKAEIAVLKSELEQIKALDLSTKLAQISTDINWIKLRLMEKK